MEIVIEQKSWDLILNEEQRICIGESNLFEYAAEHLVSIHNRTRDCYLVGIKPS